MKILSAALTAQTIFSRHSKRLVSMSANAGKSPEIIRSTRQIEQSLAAVHLKNNPEYVTAQLNEGNITLDHVDSELILNDPQLRQVGLSVNALGLKYIPHEVQTIEDVVVAVESNGLALEFANPKFAIDENILLTAVKQNGAALEFVNKSVINEQPELYYKLVAEAIKNSQSELDFIPEDILNDIKDEFFKEVDRICEVSGVDLDDANDLIRKMPVCKYDPSFLYTKIIQYFEHDKIVDELDKDNREKLEKILDISQRPFSLDKSIDILISHYSYRGDRCYIKRSRHEAKKEQNALYEGNWEFPHL